MLLASLCGDDVMHHVASQSRPLVARSGVMTVYFEANMAARPAERGSHYFDRKGDFGIILNLNRNESYSPSNT